MTEQRANSWPKRACSRRRGLSTRSLDVSSSSHRRRFGMAPCHDLSRSCAGHGGSKRTVLKQWEPWENIQSILGTISLPRERKLVRSLVFKTRLTYPIPTSSPSALHAKKLNSDRHRSNRKTQRDDVGHSWKGHEARDAGSQGPVCRWLQIPTPSQRSSRNARHRSSGQTSCDIREWLLLARTFRMQSGKGSRHPNRILEREVREQQAPRQGGC